MTSPPEVLIEGSRLSANRMMAPVVSVVAVNLVIQREL
jgi:hypothetical protein